MRKLIICIFMVSGGCLLSFAQHPSLLFTQEEVSEIRAGKGMVPELTLSKILCKWKQDSAVSLSLYLDSVFKNKHKLIHNQSPVMK